MPLLFGWFLVALFIWFAENIATYANIWLYPNQKEAWQMVPLAKLSSWYLLMLLSFVLVTLVNRIKQPLAKTVSQSPELEPLAESEPATR